MQVGPGYCVHIRRWTHLQDVHDDISQYEYIMLSLDKKSFSCLNEIICLCFAVQAWRRGRSIPSSSTSLTRITSPLLACPSSRVSGTSLFRTTTETFSVSKLHITFKDSLGGMEFWFLSLFKLHMKRFPWWNGISIFVTLSYTCRDSLGGIEFRFSSLFLPHFGKVVTA